VSASAIRDGGPLLERRSAINHQATGCVRRLVELGVVRKDQFLPAREVIAAWLENYGQRLIWGEWDPKMNFYTDIIRKDPRFRSVESVRDPALLEPVTRIALEAVIADAEKLGIRLEITETYRSVERQQHLYLTHATQLRDVGVHHYGLAADVCKIVEGKASWEGDWTFLRDLAARHGLISGVDWGHPERPHGFCDSDHVQRIRVEDQERLFAGAWYPAEDYSPRAGEIS
jgi:hypothetical protein